MKMRFLATMLALALLPRAAHAKFLPTLSIDALLFASDAVVEGLIIQTQTRDYRNTSEVKVERTLAGDDLTGQIVRLDLLLYAKREAPYGTETELQRGDRAIFFLRNAAKHPNLAEPNPHGFAVLNSGVRLLRSGRVNGFTQRSNPGGFDEVPGVPRAVFEAGFAASAKRVADLKAHLKAPVRGEDAAYFEVWNARCKSDQWSFGGISSSVNARLAQIHKLNSHKSNQ